MGLRKKHIHKKGLQHPAKESMPAEAHLQSEWVYHSVSVPPGGFRQIKHLILNEIEVKFLHQVFLRPEIHFLDVRGIQVCVCVSRRDAVLQE